MRSDHHTGGLMGVWLNGVYRGSKRLSYLRDEGKNSEQIIEVLDKQVSQCIEEIRELVSLVETLDKELTWRIRCDNARRGRDVDVQNQTTQAPK